MSNEFFKPPLYEDLTPKDPEEVIPPTPAQTEEEEEDHTKPQDYRPTPFSKHQGIPSGHEISEKDLHERTFSNAMFIEEASLLTNVEDYSRRVREEADAYAHKTREEADLIKAQIELDRGKQEILIQEAQDEKQRIIQEAEATKEEIHAQAREQGYQEGFEQGKQDHFQENRQIVGQILQLLREVKDLRLQAAGETEGQLVDLALLLAQKVVKRELSSNRAFVVEMLKSSLHRFEGMGRVKIRVNPVEYDFVLAHEEEFLRFLESQQEISFMADQGIAPGSALIESSSAVVNMDLTKQFEEIKTALLDSHEERKPLFQPRYGSQALDPEEIEEEVFTPEPSDSEEHSSQASLHPDPSEFVGSQE